MTKISLMNAVDPTNIARKIHRDMDIDTNNAIDLEYIINQLNIRMIYKEIKPEILGACKSVGLKKLIVINPNIASEGRKRFTIAHEIGHLSMHHGLIYCTDGDMSIFVTKKDKEKQANLFASELLLPFYPIKKILSYKDISINLIEEISNKYKSSFISTAIRLVSITSDPVAIFYHSNDKILWSFKSTECCYELENSTINITSLAGRFNHDNIIQKGYVDIESWFITKINNCDINCYEETIYFNNLDSFLTIVKIEDLSN